MAQTTLPQSMTSFSSTAKIETLDSVITRTVSSITAQNARADRAKQIFKLGSNSRNALMVGDAAPEAAIPTLDDLLATKAKAPSSTAVAVVPTSPSDSDLASLHNIRLLEAYISAAASAILYNGNPKGWNVTDPKQAADFIQQSTNAQFRVITEGLPSILNFGPRVTQNFTKSTTSADLHLEFLNSLFGSFGFSPQTLGELDGILTKVTQNLSELKVSFSDQTQTLNHVITFHYPEKVMNTDLNDWKLRLFFLQVDQHSWSVSVGKSTVTHLDFNMTYFDNTSDLNDEQLERNRPAIQTYIDTLTKQGFSAIEKLTTPAAVVSDATTK